MSKNVMLVDDSAMIRMGLGGCLRKSSKWKNVFLAKNGLEALEIIKKEKINVILTDIEMPGMDGFEMIKEIKAMERKKEISKIPIIVLSGTMHENDANVRKAKMLGAVDVFSKPGGKSETLIPELKLIEKKLEELAV